MCRLLPLLLVGCGFSGGGTAVDHPDDATAGSGSGSGSASDAAFLDAPMQGSDGGSGSGSSTCTPTTNHDEDGDGVADDCDPCPQINGENPLDTDGDGLPDACDPRPTQAGDHLVKFFGFDPAAGDLTALGWSAQAGAITQWSGGGDSITIVEGTGTQIITYNAGIANVAMDVGFKVLSHATTAGRHQAFFDELVNASASIDEYIAAGAYYDNAGNGRELFDYDVARSSNNGFQPLAESALDPPAANATYRMVLVSTTSQPAYLSSTTTGVGAITLTAADNRHANQHVGLRTQNASTEIHYVAIYGY